MPPFKKGHKKVGGNTKGSKHKSTEIRDYVKDEPIEKVINLLETGSIRDTDKAKIWMEVCKYFYKTPKDSIDVNLNNVIPQILVADEETKSEIETLIKNANDSENI